MRGPSLACVLILGSAHAYAQPAGDDTSVHAQTDDAKAKDKEALPPPLVPHLLEDAHTTQLTIDVATDHKRARYAIGPIDVYAQGDWLAGRMFDGTRLQLHGWSVSAGGTYRTRFGTFHVGASVADIDSELGWTRQLEFGIGLTRWFRLFGLRAFADISIGRSQWLGRPPIGEDNATAVRLKIGVVW
jgi:hypothetical protein